MTEVCWTGNTWFRAREVTLTGCGGRGIAKAFGGFASGGVGLQEAIGVGQVQDAFDHAAGSCETEHTSGGLQARKAIYNFSQARTVKSGQPGKVQDHAGAIFAEQFVESQLQLLALDAYLERPAQFKDEDSRLEFFSDDLQKVPS
jgi:hypothetical protein